MSLFGIAQKVTKKARPQARTKILFFEGNLQLHLDEHANFFSSKNKILTAFAKGAERQKL